MTDGRLPGVETVPDQIVAHVDMDCFYAACERRRDPALEGEPVVVGMGYEPGEAGGVVATASYEAREHGVESAQPIETALDRLPRRTDEETASPTGIYRPVDLDYYESVSEEVRAVLREYADRLRVVSIDEAYLDVTDRTDWDRVEAVATELKTAIADSTGVTASVGVAPTMSAAKIASDRDKPDGLTVVPPGSVRSFLADLDVEAIHEVGPKTARRLRERSIETAGDLASADPAALEAAFGDRGLTIRQYARGEDARTVEPRGDPKSLSRQSSFANPTEAVDRIRARIETLARAVAERARQQDALYRTIGITVVTPPFEVHTRERSLAGPVADEALLVETAGDLLAEFEGRRIRKVGVRVSNLSVGAREQADLAGYETTAESSRRPPQRSLAEFGETDASPDRGDEQF